MIESFSLTKENVVHLHNQYDTPMAVDVK